MHALGDLPVSKDELLPNLSCIFFEDVERSEIVVKECEDAGVKMEFWQPSTKVERVVEREMGDRKPAKIQVL